MDIEKFLSSYNRNEYQRDNFDRFLHKIGFSFSVPAIHISGSNGKGSTAAYIANIYEKNGYFVGLFTSPDTFYESIKINSKCIEEQYVEECINEYEKYFKKFDLSSFEIETFIALKYFQERKVDIAVIECGMGGEIDATNIFTPILSIITSVSIEHSAFLGDSLSEIAEHKAGIIKENVPVLLGNIEGDALTTIVLKAKEEKSDIIVVDHYHNYVSENNSSTFDYRPYSNLKINNPTKYSVSDASLALEAIKILNNRFPVEEEKLREGLLATKLKARFEIIDGKPIIVLDGAHNPEAITSLRQEIDNLYPGKKINVVFASFRDKNIINMLPEISLVGKVYLTTFDHPRARNKDEYFLFLNDYDFVDDYKALLNTLISDENIDVIVVSGSLAFAYEVRDYLMDIKR